MANRVRWVKGNDPDASDAAPTVSKAPVTWERATKVLAMNESVDADDTNPVPAVARKRLALADGTEEILVEDVLEVAPPKSQRKVSVAATCEIQADDVLEEVTVPKNAQRDRKTDPPEWRNRKTEPPAARDAKTDPPARVAPRGAAVPHWTDPAMPQIPPPAPLPSTPPWVSDARPIDPRREATKVHLRPPEKAPSRAPWMILGAAVGAAVAAAAVIILLPSTETSATTAKVPTFHHVGVKHSAERTGRGVAVPVFAVGSLPTR